MPEPDTYISKRERRRHKSKTAAWESIRKEGIVRFLLVRGVLLRGAPIVIAFVLFLPVPNNDFRIYPEVVFDPLNMGLMATGAIVIGVR